LAQPASTPVIIAMHSAIKIARFRSDTARTA
jgi:hypothetical protein